MDKYHDSRDADVSVSEHEDAFVSFSSLMVKLRNKLAVEGYFLIAEPRGYFGGFNVYEVRKPSVPSGITIDRSFKTLVRLETRQDYEAFQTVIADVCRACSADANEHFKAWVKVYKGFTDDVANKNNPLLSASLAEIKGNRGVRPSRTLSGKVAGCQEWVPPRDAFDPEVQAITPEQLLAILPPAERDTFMLFIGRVLAGINGDTLADGEVSHGARMLVMVIGEAGVGKSTLQQYLADAMNALGYTCKAFGGEQKTSFGWVPAVLASMVTIDDLTDEYTGRMLNDHRIKTLASSGQSAFREMYSTDIDLQCRAGVFMLANSMEYRQQLTLDGGVLNRLHQLECYSKDELEANGTAITPVTWNALSQQLGYPVQTMATWLLRLCLDRFLEVTGHTWVNGVLQPDFDKNRLEKVLDANREQYRIKSGLTHIEEIVSAAAHMTALTIATNPSYNPDKLLAAVGDMSFSPTLLLAVLFPFIKQKQLEGRLATMQLHELSRDIRLNHLGRRLTDLDGSFVQKLQDRTIDQAFSDVTSEMMSVYGIKYPHKMAAWSSLWFRERRKVAGYVPLYVGVDSMDDMAEPLRASVAKVLKLLQ